MIAFWYTGLELRFTSLLFYYILKLFITHFSNHGRNTLKDATLHVILKFKYLAQAFKYCSFANQAFRQNILYRYFRTSKYELMTSFSSCCVFPSP